MFIYPVSDVDDVTYRVTQFLKFIFNVSSRDWIMKIPDNNPVRSIVFHLLGMMYYVLTVEVTDVYPGGVWMLRGYFDRIITKDLTLVGFVFYYLG